MAIAHSFYSEADLAVAREFLDCGYVIRPVADRDALDQLRREIVSLVADHLGRPMPNDIDAFLNSLHRIVPVADLNRLRLAVYWRMNGVPWVRPTYFALGRSLLESLVGNELAMQNRINLSIQYPDDDSSLLDLHADVFSGETPYQVVQWLPLVDCHDTKSMFILPMAKSRQVTAALARYANGGMSAVYDAVKGELEWLTVPYGSVLLFSPNCLHGNVVNRVPETRWSMNCRFTGLFTPYTSEHKKLGSFYLPITVRPVSRIGMAYAPPQGFEE